MIQNIASDTVVNRDPELEVIKEANKQFLDKIKGQPHQNIAEDIQTGGMTMNREMKLQILNRIKELAIQNKLIKDAYYKNGCYSPAGVLLSMNGIRNEELELLDKHVNSRIHTEFLDRIGPTCKNIVHSFGYVDEMEHIQELSDKQPLLFGKNKSRELLLLAIDSLKEKILLG